MSNETNTRTATPTASPLTAQGTQQPVMVKRIGKTTYRVKLHFSETSKETMTLILTEKHLFFLNNQTYI